MPAVRLVSSPAGKMLLGALCLLSAAGCGSHAADYKPELSSAPLEPQVDRVYRFGVPPMRTTRQLFAVYDPLLDQINVRLRGFTLRLESAQIEPVYDEKVRRGNLDVAMVDPHHVLELEPLGYEVIARAGNADRIAGVLVVSAQSPVRALRDLRGATIVFPSDNSLASTMLVKAEMKQAGFDPERSARIVYSGSDESALQMVAVGAAEAAGISRATWRRVSVSDPELAARLKVNWQTMELPGNAVMAHKRLLPQERLQIARALLRIPATEAGRAALAQVGLRSFHRGEAASYDEVWEFLLVYKRLFGRPRAGERS